MLATWASLNVFSSFSSLDRGYYTARGVDTVITELRMRKVGNAP